MNKKRILSILLILCMLFTMAPAAVFADTPAKAKVSFTAQAEGAFLCAPQVDVEVSSDLAESYGYTDSVTGAVSALDVLVKAHEIIFGDDKDTINACLEVGEYGWATNFLGLDQTLALL